jgi:hypothetical protein
MRCPASRVASPPARGVTDIPAERRLARTEKYDIIRHQGEQADKIAAVDGSDPGRT